LTESSEPLEYIVPPVDLTLSGRLIGSLNLYEYQDQAVRVIEQTPSCLLEVYAGTGMGKTAVAAVTAVGTPTKTALFVYPTNELIENQVRSLKKTCAKMGEQEPEIVIVHAAQLLELMTTQGLGTKSAALKDSLYPRLDGGPKFVLTNPDTLHLILHLRYGSPRRYGQQAAEVVNQLLSYQTLVVDEFHSYEKRELSSLYFDIALARYLGVFSKILLMTATPHTGLEPHLDVLARVARMTRPQPVVAKAGHDGRRAVHEVRFSIVPQAEDGLLRMRDYLVSLRETLVKLRRKNGSDDYIPACVILNSVISARTLTEMLLEAFNDGEIKESHGLVPQQLRRDRAGALVLVGTSAIEVGIDFDTSYLLFEAIDAPSALQRLGRVGRHRTGEAIMFAPRFVYRYFEEYVQCLGSREALSQHMRAAFGDKDPGIWYLSSPIARLEAELTIRELVRSVTSTVAAGSYASSASLEKFFERLYRNDDNGLRDEWRKAIEETAHSLATFRSSEPQALVIDRSAERKGLFPAYFSPLSRVLRRARKFRVRGMDPSTSLGPLYAISKKMEGTRQGETLHDLIHEYRLHVDANRKFCVIEVFDYMRDRARYVRMSYSGDRPLPSSISFEPLVGVNKDDFLGPPIGLNIDADTDVLDRLFTDRLYAIVDRKTQVRLGWGLESYPIAESQNGARVYFDGGALVALACYQAMTSE